MKIASFRRCGARALLGSLAAASLAYGVAEAGPKISRGQIVETESRVAVEAIAEGLASPWGMAWLPNGDAVITERGGSLRMLAADGALSEPIPFPVAVTAGGDGGITSGQGGLLDVSASPDFAEDALLFFTYSTGDAAANRTCVGRGAWRGRALENFQEIYCNPVSKNAGQHFGARIAHLPDDTMLVTIGDGGNPPILLDGGEIRRQAQNPANPFGAILRLTRDGAAAEGGPTIEGAAPEIWSYGHRNAQGIVVDAETGAIWANEHGAAGGDELNRLAPGANYGWPAVTFSRNYPDGSLISKEIAGPDFADATVVWLDTIAPSSLLMYRGAAFPEWDGALISSGLVSRDLRVVRVDAEGRFVSERRVPLDARLRDVDLTPSGDLVALTDDGRLLRLTPRE